MEKGHEDVKMTDGGAGLSAACPGDGPQEVVVAARELAEQAHRGQVDKSGAAYITHPLRVAARVQGQGPHAVAVAWLHDVVEDTPLTAEHLHFLGMPVEVVEAVVALTRLPTDAGDDYYRRVAANELALRVKLADIDDNTDPARLLLLDQATQQRLRSKYDHARRVLAAATASTAASDV